MASKGMTPVKLFSRGSPRKFQQKEVESENAPETGTGLAPPPLSRAPLCPIPLPSQVSDATEKTDLTLTPRGKSKLQNRFESASGTPDRGKNRFGWHGQRAHDRDLNTSGDDGRDVRTPSKLSRTFSGSDVSVAHYSADASDIQLGVGLGHSNVVRPPSSNQSTPRAFRGPRNTASDVDGVIVATPSRNVSRVYKTSNRQTALQTARPPQSQTEYQPIEVPHFELREDPSFWKEHNVQVLIRCRPLNSSELSAHGYSRCIRQETSHTLTWIGHPECRFTFDHVAGEKITQEKLFEIAGIPMIDNCMSGYNSCMFAYGQTGSGKTHTMLGDIGDLEQRPSENRGMTPRIFEYLFRRITLEEENRKNERLKFTCKCSFLEIYNEQITDLLEPSSSNLQMREDLKKGVYVESLSEVEVNSVQDVIFLLLQGAQNRRVAATNMNKESSRSHSVFTCIIESQWESDNMTNIRFGRLNLVDLAGSERQKSSGAEGERLKEAANINKSLSTLGLVIMILVDVAQGKHRHVPYRDSKLTFLLQDSLGGNSKTTIIANVSPSVGCASETLSTLKFAQRAKFIKNNAVVNEDAAGDVLALRLQIQQLKDELRRLSRQSISRVPHSLTSNSLEYPGHGGFGGTLNTIEVIKTDENAAKKIKSLESVVAGSLRREQSAEITVKRLKQEIDQLSNLVKQREDDAQFNKMMIRFREEKIRRLESTVSGILAPEIWKSEEIISLQEELNSLRIRLDKNPELTRFAMENIRLMEQLQRFQEFYEGGEREVLLAEIGTLRDQLLEYMQAKQAGGECIDDDGDVQMLDSSMSEEGFSMIKNHELHNTITELKALLTEKEEKIQQEISRSNELENKLSDYKHNMSLIQEELRELQVKIEHKNVQSEECIAIPESKVLEQTIQDERNHRKEAEEKAIQLSLMLKEADEKFNEADKKSESLKIQLEEAVIKYESQIQLLEQALEDERASRQLAELQQNKLASQLAEAMEGCESLRLQLQEASNNFKSETGVHCSRMDLEERISEISLQLQESLEKNSNLSIMLEDTESRCENFRVLHEQAEAKEMEISKKFQSEMQALERVIQDEQACRKETEEHVINLTMQVEESEDKILRLGSLLEEAENKCSSLSEQLKASEYKELESSEKLQLDVSALEVIVNEERFLREQIEESNIDLRSQFAESLENSKRLESLLSESQKRVERLSSQLEECNVKEVEISKKLLASTEEINQYKMLIESLEDQVLLSAKELNDLQEKNAKILEGLTTRENELRTLTDCVELLQSELQHELETRMVEMESNSGGKASELKEKLDRTKKALKQAQNLNKKLKKEQDLLKAIEQEKDLVRGEAETETTEAITDLQNEIVNLQNMAEEREKELQNRIVDLEVELASLKSDLDCLHSETAELHNLNKEKDTEIHQLKHDWELVATNVIEYLSEGNQALDAAAQEIEDMVDEYSAENNGLKSENLVEVLKRRLVQAQKLAKQTETKVRVLSDATLAIAEAQRQEKLNMQNELESLSVMVESKNSVIDHLRATAEPTEKMVMAVSIALGRYAGHCNHLVESNKRLEESVSEMQLLLQEKQGLLQDMSEMKGCVEDCLRETIDSNIIAIFENQLLHDLLHYHKEIFKQDSIRSQTMLKYEKEKLLQELDNERLCSMHLNTSLILACKKSEEIEEELSNLKLESGRLQKLNLIAVEQQSERDNIMNELQKKLILTQKRLEASQLSLAESEKINLNLSEESAVAGLAAAVERDLSSTLWENYVLNFQESYMNLIQARQSSIQAEREKSMELIDCHHQIQRLDQELEKAQERCACLSLNLENIEESMRIKNFLLIFDATVLREMFVYQEEIILEECTELKFDLDKHMLKIQQLQNINEDLKSEVEHQRLDMSILQLELQKSCGIISEIKSSHSKTVEMLHEKETELVHAKDRLAELSCCEMDNNALKVENEKILQHLGNLEKWKYEIEQVVSTCLPSERMIESIDLVQNNVYSMYERIEQFLSSKLEESQLQHLEAMLYKCQTVLTEYESCLKQNDLLIAEQSVQMNNLHKRISDLENENFLLQEERHRREEAIKVLQLQNEQQSQVVDEKYNEWDKSSFEDEEGHAIKLQGLQKKIESTTEWLSKEVGYDTKVAFTEGCKLVLSEVEKEVGSCREQAGLAWSKYEQLLEEKRRMETLMADQEMTVSLLKEENLDLKSQLQELIEMSMKNRESLEQKQHAIHVLQMEIMKMEQQKVLHVNLNLRQALQEKDICMKERDELHAEVVVLNEQLEMAQQLADERETLAIEARQIAESSKALAEEKEDENRLLERSIEELESTINALETQVSQLKTEKENERLLREDIEMELQALKHQMSQVHSVELELEEQHNLAEESQRMLEVKAEQLHKAQQSISTLEKQTEEKDELIRKYENDIQLLVLEAERQATEHQENLRNLENMAEQKSCVQTPPAAKVAKSRGSSSPFKCIGMGLSQQMSHDIEEELNFNKQKVEELEALASSRQKEIFMLNIRLAEAESMTHDIIRDLVGVKLDITNYASLVNSQQLQKFAEKSYEQNEACKEKDQELEKLRNKLNEFIEERESWLEEINRRQAEMMTARVAAEKLRQRDQLLSSENDSLKAENASQKKRLTQLEEEVKKLSGQQNLQQRIHHHAKIKEENNSLRLKNEDLATKLRRSELLLSRVSDELAKYRAADGKPPQIDLEEEQRLQAKLKAVEEEKIQVAQELLTLCTNVLKVAGITRPGRVVDHNLAAEALSSIQERLDATEHELSDMKLKNKIDSEKRRLSELRSLHSPLRGHSSYVSSQKPESPLHSSR